MNRGRGKAPLSPQAAIEHGWRSTNTHLAEAVRMIAAHAPGDHLVSEFLPHHDRFVVEGMRITRERCDDVITVMQAVIKELDRLAVLTGRPVLDDRGQTADLGGYVPRNR